MTRETYRCEYVKCGKRGCKKCPHGPYWYVYWREGKKMKKRYVGVRDPRIRQSSDSDPHPWDAVFSIATTTEALCWEILGLRPGASLDVAYARYQEIVHANRPEVGGDRLAALRASNAYWWLFEALG